MQFPDLLTVCIRWSTLCRGNKQTFKSPWPNTENVSFLLTQSSYLDGASPQGSGPIFLLWFCHHLNILQSQQSEEEKAVGVTQDLSIVSA